MVAEYIAERFERTGRAVGTVIEPLLELAQGHPQRTMLLAHAVWERTATQQAATEETWMAAADAVMRDVRDEFRSIWISLKPSHRRMLAVIAENTGRLYASERRRGGSRGGAISTAARVLEDRGEIMRDASRRTGYRVTDPLLAGWVNQGRPDT